MSRPVGALFAPRSVAVVGASETRTKWGYWLATGALRGRGKRPVHLVNRGGGALEGLAFAPSLASVGEQVDLVVVSVPATSFESSVDEALASGARAVVGVTAGLPAPAAVAVVQRVRASGAVLLGPNCLGVYAADESLSLLWGDLPAGDIALISQSGNLALELGAIAARGGLGMSRFASLGNAADLTAVDLLAECAAHDGTRAVALYLESIGDGRALMAAAAASVDGGTPVVMLSAGRSAAGARAAGSHTGALASDAAVLAAACRDAGVILVDTPTALIEATRVAALRRRPAGRRLGIVGDGGGHGVVAADLAAAAGLEVVPFSERLSGALARELPPGAGTGNPVDLAGGGERDLHTYARVVSAVADSGEVDAVLLTGYFGAYGADEPTLAPREVEVACALARTAVPVLAHSMASVRAPAVRALTDGGVPVWGAIEHATAALAALAQPSRRGTPRGDGYLSGRALLESVGVPVVAARTASGAKEAVAAAEELGYPVAVKALGLAHKSDVGGVALGLGDAESVAAAAQTMLDRLVPPGLVVERMADLSAGVELIVGARRDRDFGPVVLVGLGGVLTEVLADSAVGLAPLDREAALAMVTRLRGAPLLTGFRGRPAVSVDALVDVLVSVSRLIAASADVAELDVNPLLVTPDGAVALDAHVDWAQR